MRGDPVPDTDHVARYCGGSTIHPDGTVDGSAFRLRKQEGEWENYLSVNWLELLDLPNLQVEIAALQQLFAKKFKKVGATARFATLNCGEVRTHVRSETGDTRELHVRPEPERPHDPSHSGIYGLRPDDDLIADLIAEVVQETYPARG